MPTEWNIPELISNAACVTQSETSTRFRSRSTILSHFGKAIAAYLSAGLRYTIVLAGARGGGQWAISAPDGDRASGDICTAYVSDSESVAPAPEADMTKHAVVGTKNS